MATTKAPMKTPSRGSDETTLAAARVAWLACDHSKTARAQVLDALCLRVRVRLDSRKVHIRCNSQSAFALMMQFITEKKSCGSHEEVFGNVGRAYRMFEERCAHVIGEPFSGSPHGGWENLTYAQYGVFLECILESPNWRVPLAPTSAWYAKILKPESSSDSSREGDVESESKWATGDQEPDTLSVRTTRWVWASFSSNLMRTLHSGQYPLLEQFEALAERPECCWWHQYGRLEESICCPDFDGVGIGSPGYETALARAREGPKVPTETVPSSVSGSAMIH